jgi:hypothetical protein
MIVTAFASLVFLFASFNTLEYQLSKINITSSTVIDPMQVDDSLLQLKLSFGVFVVSVLVIFLLDILKNKSFTPDKVIYVQTSSVKENLGKEESSDEDQKAILDIKGENDQEVFYSLCKKIKAVAGIYYMLDPENQTIQSKYSYIFTFPEEKPLKYLLGEGMVGQAAKLNRMLEINDIPNDYLVVRSGLGYNSPNHLIIHPLMLSNSQAIIEIGLFNKPQKSDIAMIKKAVNKIEKLAEQPVE